MVVPGMACKPSSAVQIPCSFAFKPNLPRISHRHRCHRSPRSHANGLAHTGSQTQARQVAESPLSGRAALLRVAFSSILMLPILLVAPAEAADLPASECSTCVGTAFPLPVCCNLGHARHGRPASTLTVCCRRLCQVRQKAHFGPQGLSRSRHESCQ